MIILNDINIDDLDFSYNSFSIKKRDWNKRIITAPNDDLKKVQRQLKEKIERNKNVKIPNYITWFRKWLSIKDNASFHINKKLVINIDIKNFFWSITEDKIRNYFTNKVDDINKFIRLTSYNWILATWWPTSPIIWNLIFLEIDEKIISFLERNYSGFNYSRYVDDITISFNQNIDIKPLLENIKFKLENNNFTINNDKIKIFSNKHQQTVTWLVVNKKVSYPRFNYRILRSKINNYILNWKWYFPEIKGYLNFLYWVDKDKFESLKRYYSKYKDIQEYIDLFIWTTRPITTKKYSYLSGSRQSRRWHCKIEEDIDLDFELRPYKTNYI